MDTSSEYEDLEDVAEQARLKKAGAEARIGHLPGAQLKQLLALAQLLVKNLGRPDMDLAGLDLPAQQALLGVQVRLGSTAPYYHLIEHIGQVLSWLVGFLGSPISVCSHCTMMCYDLLEVFDVGL